MVRDTRQSYDDGGDGAVAGDRLCYLQLSDDPGRAHLSTSARHKLQYELQEGCVTLSKKLHDILKDGGFVRGGQTLQTSAVGNLGWSMDVKFMRTYQPQ
jgi:hypothetical protein